nr:hypothetical protein [Flavipsychrobacter sp.]
MQRDTAIFDLIKEELERQRGGLELIASENFTSMQVMQAMGNVMTNKYAEGYPGKRYYGGCEVVDKSEQLAIDRAKQIFGVNYVNVQPHSGAQANTAIFLACLQPGDTILGLDLGSNSIGWAVINSVIEKQSERIWIKMAGSRIIPMDSAVLGDFDKGSSILQTAERTHFRG